jgi:DNA-binding IscR family transcriptional regulator
VVLQDVLPALVRQGILMAGAGEPHTYLPAREPGTITLKEIVQAVRTGTGGAVSAVPGAPSEDAVEEVLNGMDAAMSASLSTKTLKDLVSPAKSN